MKLKQKKQAGVSLLELMVSLTIGLILLLALSSVYLTANRSNKTRSMNEILDETARQVFERLTADINMAGYVDVFDNQITAQKLVTPSDEKVQIMYGRLSGKGTVKTPFQSIFGEHGLEGTDRTLTLRYQAAASAARGDKSSLRTYTDATNVDAAVHAGTALNCIGNKVQADVLQNTPIVVNTYSFTKAADNNGTLSCLEEPLVSGISDLQFRYLVTEGVSDTSATMKDSYAGMYVTNTLKANEVVSSQRPLGWAGVTAVEVCLVVGAEPLSGNVQGNWMELQPTIPTCEFDADGNFGNEARRVNDQKLYRAYIKIINIPNAVYFTN